MTKNRQIGKNSPKWLKLLKLGSKWFQGVPDGSRCQTVWVRTNRGTYAWVRYALAALGQGPKGPELVTKITILDRNAYFKIFWPIFSQKFMDFLKNHAQQALFL